MIKLEGSKPTGRYQLVIMDRHGSIFQHLSLRHDNNKALSMCWRGYTEEHMIDHQQGRAIEGIYCEVKPKLEGM